MLRILRAGHRQPTYLHLQNNPGNQISSEVCPGFSAHFLVRRLGICPLNYLVSFYEDKDKSQGMPCIHSRGYLSLVMGDCQLQQGYLKTKITYAPPENYGLMHKRESVLDNTIYLSNLKAGRWPAVAVIDKEGKIRLIHFSNVPKIFLQMKRYSLLDDLNKENVQNVGTA